MQFEFRPQYANMSLKFTNVEDSYLFFSDFKEVFSMIPLPNNLICLKMWLHYI